MLVRNISWQLQQIERHMAARRFKRAEMFIARLLRQSVTDAQRIRLLEDRAKVRLSLSRPDEAIDDLRTLQATIQNFNTQPHLAELWADCHLSRYELASVGFAEKSDVREAQSIYRHLMENYPQYPNIGWVQYQYGRVMLISDHAHVAEKYFHKALHSPSHVKTLTALCYERLGFIAFFESRQAQQAIIYLDKAIDTYPDYGSAQWLVQVYILRSRVLKDYDVQQGIASAHEALHIASQQRGQRILVADASFALAELLAHQGNCETQLIRHLQQFMQISKPPLGVDVTWSRACEMLGDAYTAQGQYDEAIAAYHRALDYNPYHPWEESIQYRIANAYYQLQNYEKTVATIHSWSSSPDGRDHRLYLILGNALFALGKYAQAAEAYATGLTVAPPSANIEHMQTYLQLSREMSPSM